MEVKVSSQKPGLLPSDLTGDSEKKEISEGEDEDDDKNHKHRKRETRSQSFDGDSLDHTLTRPSRKRNKPFENGSSYRVGYSQSGETWKTTDNFSGREFPSSFEKRYPNRAPFSRVPMDLKQRISRNQPLPVEAGSVRGRGLGAWGLQSSRLDSGDLASQMVLPRPVPSGLFSGGGMPNVSNAQSTSWNAFGLVPGVPNGGLDAFHSVNFQAALGPPISLSGIPRPRCRDFEELGFCLRGDLCPMEHGVHRIVIDDVQSLSQFNLPVSNPDSNLPGNSAGQGDLPVITAASGSIVNSKPSHSSMPGMNEGGFGLTGGFADDSLAGGSDVYDPDQPLWTNDNPAASALLSFNQSNTSKMESFMDKDPADRPNTESGEGFDEHPVRSAATTGSQGSSVWGRIRSSKNRFRLKEKTDFVVTSTSQDINEKVLNTDLQDNSPQGEQVNLNSNGPQVKELSLQTRSVQKPPQKALRTLFVNGIPWKDNKREALLSHFQKFGVVTDIYIPMQSERAFVQFSKREEAEAALKAPDAVMGNRFIKLWWANRDNVPDSRMNGISDVSVAPHGVTLNSALSHSPVSEKGKENLRFAGGKDGSAAPSVSHLPVYDHPKVVIGNGPKAPPVQQKKLENLELLKEELRKKQELLDQKRNEFRRQLDKLEKQATGFKEVATDQAPTRLECETPPDSAKGENALSPTRANITTENVGSAKHDVLHTFASNPTVVLGLSSLRTPSSYSRAPITAPYVANRFKLDNRPTAFKIVSPLPAGLANVTILEEHFTSYGDLSSVELEELQPEEASDVGSPTGASAHISFSTRRSAEKAFLLGKSWRGHNLQFAWLSSSNSGKGTGVSGIPLTDSKMPEEIAPTTQKGNGEPEDITKKSGVESINQNEESSLVEPHV